MKVNVSSEIGNLQGVIIHHPGSEIENMTPQNAERALYSDILNLTVATKEYCEFESVLRKFTKVYEVKDLLSEALQSENVRRELAHKVCANEKATHLTSYHCLVNEKLWERIFVLFWCLSFFLQPPFNVQQLEISGLQPGVPKCILSGLFPFFF